MTDEYGGESKNYSDYCKHSLAYRKHIITTIQKSTRDIQEIRRQEPKRNIRESQHKESKRIRKE